MWILIVAIALLVFLVVYKLFLRRTLPRDSIISKAPAYIASWLFLFLPIHSEAVSSIVGRSELLAFLFSTLALLYVLDRRYALASVAFLFGLLSKETAAGFFLVFVYLWKFKERKTIKQIVSDSLYFILSIILYAILRAYVLGKYFLSVDHLLAYNPLKFATLLLITLVFLIEFKAFVKKGNLIPISFIILLTS